MRSVQSRAKELLAFAREIGETADNWITLNNAIYGIGGKFGELFETRQDRVAANATPELKEVGEMIVSLREAKGDPPAISQIASKANGAISLRIPKTVHAMLLAEAEAEGVSLNQLCLSKLCIQLSGSVR